MTRPHRRFNTLVLASALLSAGVLPGQTTRGLDELNDDVLIAELANRQLTPLLDRYLEQRQLPAEQRAAIRAGVPAVHPLNAPPLPTKDRLQAVAAIDANLDAVTGAIHDPRFFLQLANLL